jgi:hypothetical protein
MGINSACAETCGNCARGKELPDRSFQDGKPRVLCTERGRDHRIAMRISPLAVLLAPRIEIIRPSSATCFYARSRFSPRDSLENSIPSRVAMTDGQSLLRDLVRYFLESPRYNS